MVIEWEIPLAEILGFTNFTVFLKTLTEPVLGRRDGHQSGDKFIGHGMGWA